MDDIKNEAAITDCRMFSAAVQMHISSLY